MKKLVLVVLMIVIASASLVACSGQQSAAAELGPALVTVSGEMSSPNSGDNYVLDQAFFDDKSVEVTMDDPWMGDGIAYKGVLLRDLLTAMGADDATKITVVATDGKGLEIAAATPNSGTLCWLAGQMAKNFLKIPAARSRSYSLQIRAKPTLTSSGCGGSRPRRSSKASPSRFNRLYPEGLSPYRLGPSTPKHEGAIHH